MSDKTLPASRAELTIMLSKYDWFKEIKIDAHTQSLKVLSTKLDQEVSAAVPVNLNGYNVTIEKQS